MIDYFRRQFRRWTQPFLWRIYKWYLSKDRWYFYNNLHIKVNQSVFHPALLFSTKILLKYVLKLELKQKKVLELGAGSGLIAASVAKAGGVVTATDINPAAIKSLEETSAKNQLSFEIIESNLFANIPQQTFDLVLINPPYFPQDATTNREKAFFCGADFEYFKDLFFNLKNYILEESIVYMILSDDCKIEHIQALSKPFFLEWELVYQEQIWGETNFIFKIRKLK